MTYDFVARFGQVTSLLLFVGIFLGVLAYVFWPGNRRRFDEAQKRALDLGGEGHSEESQQ
jgi:cytochrome c oxidase cbb3-type subunit IV